MIQNPVLAGKKGELSKLAVAKLESDGYNYRKKKSRSKQLNPESDQSIKRVKLQSDLRTKGVKEVHEELTEVDKQMQYCIKQRERYSNCQQYNSAIAISDRLESLPQKKRKLQTELTMLHQKEAKSERYHKSKKRAVCSESSTVGQHSYPDLSTPVDGPLSRALSGKSAPKGDKNEITQYLRTAQECKTRQSRGLEGLTLETNFFLSQVSSRNSYTDAGTAQECNQTVGKDPGASTNELNVQLSTEGFKHVGTAYQCEMTEDGVPEPFLTEVDVDISTEDSEHGSDMEKVAPQSQHGEIESFLS